MTMSAFPAPRALDEINLAGEGLLSQNFDRILCSAGTIMVTQRVYFLLVPLRAGQVVTNAHVIVSTAGSTCTNTQVGLYDTSGTRLAASADLGNSWESTGLKTNAFSAAYTVASTGVYYVALQSVSAVTMPTLYRSPNAGIATAEAVGSGAAIFGAQSTQATLPASATIGGTNMLGYWVGLS